MTYPSGIYYRLGILFCKGFPLVTLQIGLVGSDGNIVLASDRLAKSHDGHTAQHTEVTKVLVSKDNSFAISFAGNDLALKVARAAIGIANSSNSQPWPSMIHDSIKRHAETETTGEITKCTILSVGYGKLCKFVFDRRGADADVPHEPDISFGVAGDFINPASSFFIDRYYGRSNEPDLDVSALKRLAAHVILAGHKLNPDVIAGLDMVVWNKEIEEIVVITGQEIKQLRAWSRSLDTKIERAISDGLDT